jgi:hypothetical protein
MLATIDAFSETIENVMMVASYLRLSVALDHPVTIECPYWMMFQQILSAW